MGRREGGILKEREVMQKKKRIIVIVVLVLLVLGCYFLVDYFKGKSPAITEPPAIEQEVPAPVEEETVPVEEAPVEEPAPAEEAKPEPPAPKPAAKPKPVEKPMPVEKAVAEKPVEPAPEPTPEPPAKEEPAPVPEPVPEPAEKPQPKEEPKPAVEAPVVDNNEIVSSAEVMPKFKGGNLKKFQEYINENTVYPQTAAEMGIQGRVRVSFVVEKNGSVSNVKVVKGIDPLLDREALRVVKSSPRWTPGQNNGRPVRVSQVVPVLFVLH